MDEDLLSVYQLNNSFGSQSRTAYSRTWALGIEGSVDTGHAEVCPE